MKAFKSSLVPLAAVGLGLAGAGVWYALGDAGHQPQAIAAAEPLSSLQKGTAAAGPATAAFAIQGKVLEVIDVPNYTYLRVQGSKGGEQWAAIPTTGVDVGQQVAIADASEMRDFSSPTLGRSFPSIWFGVLATPGRGSVASPHAEGMSPHGASKSVAGAVPSGGLPAHHAAPLQGGDDVAVGKVSKAAGPIGRSVAEIYGQKSELQGKRVRVRGVVVKSMSGILGQSFVHLRDGSGDAAAGSHDLTVTTQAEPKVGDTILLEGTVATDKDFGSGYTYPVLLEGASLVAE